MHARHEEGENKHKTDITEEQKKFLTQGQIKHDTSDLVYDSVIC